MLKKSIWAIMIAAISIGAFAQNVTLTASNDGETKDEAKNNAIRDAMEQAYGMFVSANTVILNDALVKDEIVSHVAGALKKYEEISSVILPNGRFYVTAQVTVSPPGLIAYAQSKGAVAELAGQTFAMNIKLMQLEKENEIVVIKNMLEYVETLVSEIFDYSLTVGEPRIVKGLVEHTCTIRITPNSNATMISDIIGNTLLSLSMTDAQQKAFKQAEMRFYELGEVMANVTRDVLKGHRQEKVLKPTPEPVQTTKKPKKPAQPPPPQYEFIIKEIWETVTTQQKRKIVLRNDHRQQIHRFMNAIIQFEKHNFKIVDNLGNTYYNDFKVFASRPNGLPKGSEAHRIPRDVPEKLPSINIPAYTDKVEKQIRIHGQDPYNHIKHPARVHQLSYQGTYVESTITGGLFNGQNTESTKDRVIINGITGDTGRYILRYSQDDLGKYSSFEIMRNE